MRQWLSSGRHSLNVSLKTQRKIQWQRRNNPDRQRALLHISSYYRIGEIRFSFRHNQTHMCVCVCVFARTFIIPFQLSPVDTRNSVRKAIPKFSNVAWRLRPSHGLLAMHSDGHTNIDTLVKARKQKAEKRAPSRPDSTQVPPSNVLLCSKRQGECRCQGRILRRRLHVYKVQSKTSGIIGLWREQMSN